MALTWLRGAPPHYAFLAGRPLQKTQNGACGTPLPEVMPILSSVIERMSYSTSRVGIPLGAYSTLRGTLHARWIPPRSVDPSMLGLISPYALTSLKYCYNSTLCELPTIYGLLRLAGVEGENTFRVECTIVKAFFCSGERRRKRERRNERNEGQDHDQRRLLQETRLNAVHAPPSFQFLRAKRLV